MKDNTQRAKNIIAFLLAYLVFDILNMGLDFYMLSIGESDLDLFNTLLQISHYMAFAEIAITIICGIHFIMWFRRAYYNLHFICVGGLRYTEGWAAGAWFVPFMNLYAPVKIMHDIWAETQRAIFRTQDFKSNNLIPVWWALWIINGLLGRIVFPMYSKAETVVDFNNINVIEIINNVVNIAAILVVTSIIKKLMVYEHELFESRNSEETSLLYDIHNEVEHVDPLQ